MMNYTQNNQPDLFNPVKDHALLIRFMLCITNETASMNGYIIYTYVISYCFISIIALEAFKINFVLNYKYHKIL